MSNSIWKMRDVEPKKYPILALGDDGKYYVFESPKLGTGDLGWKHRCHDYVKQYCYIDDLIAQADKAERLEKENEAMREEFEVWHENYKCEIEDKERLQEALEVAKMSLEDCNKILSADMKDWGYLTAEIALKKIEQLIKE